MHVCILYSLILIQMRNIFNKPAVISAHLTSPIVVIISLSRNPANSPSPLGTKFSTKQSTPTM